MDDIQQSDAVSSGESAGGNVAPAWPPAVDVCGPDGPPVNKGRVAPPDDRLPTPLVRRVMLIVSFIAGFTIFPAICVFYYLVLSQLLKGVSLSSSSAAAIGKVVALGVIGLNSAAIVGVVWFRKFLRADIVGFALGLATSLVLFWSIWAAVLFLLV